MPQRPVDDPWGERLVAELFADVRCGTLRADVDCVVSIMERANRIRKGGIARDRDHCRVAIAMDHHPFQCRFTLLYKGSGGCP